VFRNNTAYNGGAILTGDIVVRIQDSTFERNTCCGGAEGAAIYHFSSELQSTEVIVECVGDNNVFVDNINGICIDPKLNPGYEEYPCTKNCGDIGDPFCRL